MRKLSLWSALLLVGSAAATWAASPPPEFPSPIAFSYQNRPDTARIRAAYGKTPLHFEANRGQAPAQVPFLSRGSGYSLFLTAQEAILTLQHADTPVKPASDLSRRNASYPAPKRLTAPPQTTLRMRLVGANPSPQMTALQPLSGKTNYLIGQNRSQWQTDIPTYAQVKLSAVYPGIDLRYYGNQQQLEYDFILAPGANPNAIALDFAGARSLRVDRTGDLTLDTQSGPARWHKPFAYQEIGGKRRAVSARYALEKGNRVRFQVASYDTRKPLIIDPILSYSTYLGGGPDAKGNGNDDAQGIAIDPGGNAYIVGTTNASNFPTTPGAYQTIKQNISIFVTKLSPTGSLVYSTFIGANNDSFGLAIAVDSLGRATIGGLTFADNYPLRNAFQNAPNGSADAVVTQLNAAGNGLLYSTYIGGDGYDLVHGIALDDSGGAYIVGDTTSITYPMVNAFQSQRSSAALFQGVFTGNRWIDLHNGLDPGANVVYSLAVNPTNGSTLYAGTDIGVYKSTDYGANWNYINGISLPFDIVRAIAIDPGNPSTLYAGTDTSGVYQSTDGGISWQPYLFTGITTPVTSLAVDTSSGRVYAGTNGDGVFYRQGANQFVFNTGLINLSVKALALDTATHRLYAGTTGDGVFVTNGNAAWAAANGSGLTSLGNLNINALLYAPADPGTAQLPALPATLYAGTDFGVFASTDGGAHWTDISGHDDGFGGKINPPDSLQIDALALLTTSPSNLHSRILYAGTPSGVYATENRPTENPARPLGYDWALRGNLGAYDTLALTTDPGSGSTDILYAGVDRNTNRNDTTFFSKLDTNGSGIGSLLYSTLIGGSQNEDGWKVTVDPSKMAYIVGFTPSTDFPATGPLQLTQGGGFFGGDGYVVKFDATAAGSASLVWSTYLGGSGDDAAFGVAVNASGVYVTGFSGSTDFPLKNAYQTVLKGGFDAFITHLDANGALVYSTRLGGTGNEAGRAMALDSAGNAFVALNTNSTDFPMVNPIQGSYGGGADDTVVAKLSANGSSLLFSTYLGGTGSDFPLGIAVDTTGNLVFVVGVTDSAGAGGYPVTPGALQPSFGGGSTDAFVTKIALNVSAVTVSGTITLESYSNQAQPITFEFRPTDNSGNFTRTATLTATGAFSLTNIPNKNYKVWIKGAKWLAKVVTVNASGGNVSNVTATLLGGDANNDNLVDFDDLTILAIAYNTVKGDPLYDDRADFTGDNQVEFADLTVLAINYNLNGDP